MLVEDTDIAKNKYTNVGSTVYEWKKDSIGYHRYKNLMFITQGVCELCEVH